VGIAAGAEAIRRFDIRTARFVLVGDLLADIRATWNRRDGLSEADVLKGPMGVELLVLDDLGADKDADWSVERLHRLIKHRHMHQLTTIITTNLKPTALGAYVGDGTASRIRQLAIPVSLDGCSDLRVRHVPANVVPIRAKADA
jgi:DNA replication protein DnaC